jgi:hypothetical protein
MRLITEAIALAIAASICFLGLRGWSAAEQRHRLRFIPAKLHTTGFYVEGRNCGDLLSFQGAYIFGLDASTTTELRKRGIRFFGDIDVGGNQAPAAYFSGGWRSTPIPDTAINAVLGNMLCAMDGISRWPKGITDALRRPGSFYQTAGGRSLLVLPNLGYVVAVASDR